jgi:beta-lactam-binding protein with PASTA domain/tRNA A-37 threonylcarbamoyl transferase component Bud32
VVARTPDQLGRVLGGRYRLAAAIGTGASAQVFLADDITLRRRVAVKILHPALASDEAFLRRFRAEARAAAALSHPNLMAVYDWGEDDGPYLVLEYLGGGSLRALLDRGTRLTPSQALLVGLEAARALDVAHRRGFVHRDIKPANLLFGDDARLRIADFGLARALSEAGWTEPGDGLVGTARYAAPEQARGGKIDGRADVYSLGLVLVEAVTGTVPLTSPEGALPTMMARLETAVPVPEELGLLRPILERVGQPDPDARPDAAELGRALLVAAREMDRPAPLPLPGVDLNLLDVEPFAESTFGGDDDLTVMNRGDATGVLPQVSRRRRRRWPWVLLGLLVVAGVVGGGALAARQFLTPSAPVPDVATRSYEDALARIQAADRRATDVDWQIRKVDEFNDNVPPGVVISQQPIGGAGLDDGGTIRLVVSQGPHPVDLPLLDNATVPTAEAALLEAGLRRGTVTPRHHEAVPAGVVITWSVGGQDRPAEAPKGSAVDLTVSAGPAPRTVPAVAGLSPDAAKAALAQGDSRFAVAVVEEFSDEVEAGLAIRTNPPAGAKAARGASVTLYVSKGPDLVEVPSIRGAGSLEEAVQRLEAAGLVAGEVYGPARGRPYETDPPSGTSVKRGSSVDIYLRR